MKPLSTPLWARYYFERVSGFKSPEIGMHIDDLLIMFRNIRVMRSTKGLVILDVIPWISAKPLQSPLFG
jgi:hypothetical protein